MEDWLEMGDTTFFIWKGWFWKGWLDDDRKTLAKLDVEDEELLGNWVSVMVSSWNWRV